ncbi:MAG: hypothetical protein K0Q81_400 [Paenibacillus sp.]|nr:hypothetical protein [Paenibacillus sp.]
MMTNYKNLWNRLVTGLLVISLSMAMLLVVPEPAKADFYDTRGHWAADTVNWGVSLKLVNGYEDGGFHPDQVVTEAEFLAMLLRTFALMNSGYVETLTPWYGAYFQYASGQNWPVELSRANEYYQRGEVARLIAATQGQQLKVDESISFLLQHKLVQGKTAATVDGFGKYDTLTRAESLQLIRNLVDKRLTLMAAPPGDPAVSQTQPAFAVRGVAIGDTESSVTLRLGQPQRVDVSEYAFHWYIYNADYNNYAQIGILDGEVVAIYSNAANWSTNKDIRVGSTSVQVKAAYGTQLKDMLKGNIRFQLEEVENEPTYLLDGNYVTIFLDAHDSKKAAALLVIKKQVEDGKAGYYGAPSDALRDAYERQSFDLANVSRVKFGKKVFNWNDAVAGTARKHSEDMANNTYFDHENLSGKSPFDRMKDDGIKFTRAAENIAAGQTSAIFAHSGWMNSLGHRLNVLGETTQLGVGVYFGGTMKIYYTQNFFTP